MAFWVLAAVAVLCSLLVITSRNPVASVLYLVVTFFCIAGLFVTLHSHFLAAIQVIVYAGAIMVLFLFVVMLLNLGTPQWFDIAASPLKAAALVLGVGFVGALVAAGVGDFEPSARGPASAVGADVLGSTEAIAAGLYSTYYLPFLVTALLLLVAMVGAVVLARRER